MDLTRVIMGPIVTEKAERLKTARTYTLRVDPQATKVDVQNALRRHYDVQAESVRAMRTNSKSRAAAGGRSIQKRQSWKKVMVTLTKDSKPFDSTSFKA